MTPDTVVALPIGDYLCLLWVLWSAAYPLALAISAVADAIDRLTRAVKDTTKNAP